MIIKSKNLTERIFNEKTSLILTFIAVGIFILTIIIFVANGSWKFSLELDEAKIGQFGDFVGGLIGTILAFVASVLYLVALREQRKDIAINQESSRLQNLALLKQIEEFEKQKEELELTRRVYEQQSRTMADQERTIRIQRFESNFYSLLELCTKIKSELNNQCRSNDYFKDIYDSLKNRLLQRQIADVTYYELYEITNNEYINVFLEKKGQLAHYFKTFYRLMKILDSNEVLTTDEKTFYAKIVRSQLADYELQILSYNYHSRFASKGRLLSYKYNLLKHNHSLAKIELVNKYGTLCDDLNMTAFNDFMNEELLNSINDFIDNFDQEEKQTMFETYNCILSISNDDYFKIKIDCLTVELLPKHFFQIAGDLIYEKLFISQYQIVKDGILSSNCIETSNNSMEITFILNSGRVRKLNLDN